jgi:PIN domain nuclease of toxin-antitoxin system
VYLLDTHAWLWLVMGRASTTGFGSIDNSKPWALSAISLWEVAMLESFGRVVFEMPLAEWFTKALRPDCYRVLPITPDIAVASGKLPPGMHGDPADRIIAATACVHRATLITADRRLLDCAERAGYGTLPITKD